MRFWYRFVYIYLHQADDQIIYFLLLINKSATLGKTKSFQLRFYHLFGFDYFLKSIIEANIEFIGINDSIVDH